jgi:hypothetical protein
VQLRRGTQFGVGVVYPGVGVGVVVGVGVPPPFICAPMTSASAFVDCPIAVTIVVLAKFIAEGESFMSRNLIDPTIFDPKAGLVGCAPSVTEIVPVSVAITAGESITGSIEPGVNSSIWTICGLKVRWSSVADTEAVFVLSEIPSVNSCPAFPTT